MSKLFIDLSGTAGLAPKFYGDANDTTGRPQLRTSGAKGQMAQGYWNPYRAFGYLVPPTSMVNSSVAITETDATYDFNAEMKASIYDKGGTNGSNGKGVWLADDVNVWAQNGGSNAFTMTNIMHLATNTPKITDFEMYQVNGVKKLFVSYQETAGVGGDIGLINPDAGGTNPTWLSGTVAGAFQTGATNEVVMISADNGYMYILDGSTLHKIDGTSAGGANGTAYPNLLVFPPDFILVDGVDWKAHLWIAVHTFQSTVAGNTVSYNERVVGIYSWDRQSVTTNMQDFIPVTGLIAIKKVYITSQGELRLIGISSERSVQIRRYNGSTFEIIQELPLWAFPPRRDSCTHTNGLFVWLGNDGKLYGHGRLPALQSGNAPYSYTADQIFLLGDMSGLPNIDFSAGAILAYGAGSAGSFSSPPTSVPGIIFSYSASGGTNKVYQWFMNGTGTISSKAQVADAGNVYTLVQRLPGLAQVNWIRVWHLPVGSGGTTQMGTFTLYENQSASATTNGAVSITQTDVQRGFKYIPMGAKGFNDFAIQFSMAWQTSTALSDTADWQPYAIEVDYTEDPKLK